MATLVLTAQGAVLAKLAHEIQAAANSAGENRLTTVTVQDSDLSVTYTDGQSGTKKKSH